LTWVTAKVKEQRSTGSGPNIVVVNISFGMGLFPLACDDEGQYAGVLRRIRELKGEGVAVVAAAGNNGSNGVSFPACISEVVAIGATDRNDKISSFSNYSNLVTLFTPGEGIVSSVYGGDYETLSGTSMATAVATGAFALLMGAFPEMDVDTITTALKTKGRQLTVPQTNATVRAIDVASSYAFLRILASELEEAKQAQPAPGVAR
jgi:subtilisin family serine protease